MTDATTKLFQELVERGYEPALEKATGTLRFDLASRLDVTTTSGLFPVDVNRAAISKSSISGS